MMNYIYLLIEVILVFSLMIIFYKLNKKDGLYLYITLMASILGIVMYKTIDILSFQINLGLPIIMGIFTCNNIIIHRYGLDEIKKIIYTFLGSCVLTVIILGLVSLFVPNDYNYITNASFDLLFGYNFVNMRYFIASLISIILMIWFSGNVYYYIRRSRNSLLFSNVGTILLIQFIESILFVIISFVGTYDVVTLFGMIVIRYLLKIIIGIVGLFPVYLLVKRKDW